MKSNYMSSRNHFMLDPPSFLVDPNLVLESGPSSSKGNHDLIINKNGTSTNDHYIHQTSDELFNLDWINYSDSQLEDLILGDGTSGVCDGIGSLSFSGLLNDDDLTYLKTSESFYFEGIKSDSSTIHLDDKLITSIENSNQEYDVQNVLYSYDDVANYEEVYADEKLDQLLNVLDCNNISTEDPIKRNDSDQEQEYHSDDDHSVLSFATQSSVESSINKRKFNHDFSSEVSKITKRRRAKRILDERIKYQNKVAAMRYRLKKREEKNKLEDILLEEMNRNKKLTNNVEELKVQINVLKELLSKYLSSKLFTDI